jgi:ParB family chromosome partitioning protein
VIIQTVRAHNGIEFTFVGAYEEIEASLITPTRAQIRNSYGDLNSLVASIRENGLVEPIVVRPSKDHFEIVAGNRRYAACRKLNFRRIPSLVVNFDDRQAYEAALVENIQRKTLDPIEEAQSFKRYCEEYGWGSESELASKIGKSQEYISHRLQLLNLPEKAKELIKERAISPSIAEEISWLKNPRDQENMIDLVLDKGLNRDQTRDIIKTMKKGKSAQTEELGWISISTQKEFSDPDDHVLERAILAMRIVMVRLDSLIEKAQSKALRNVLLNKRVLVHQILDDVVSYKMGRDKQRQKYQF